MACKHHPIDDVMTARVLSIVDDHFNAARINSEVSAAELSEIGVVRNYVANLLPKKSRRTRIAQQTSLPAPSESADDDPAEVLR